MLDTMLTQLTIMHTEDLPISSSLFLWQEALRTPLRGLPGV